MSAEALRRHVAEAIAEVAPEADLASVDPKGPLRAQLDLDSMDFLRVLQGLSRRTGVDVPERDYAKVATLEGLLAYLDAHAVTTT